MPTTRTYGSAPYRIVLLHGGPGAPGYMAPVARELSRDFGVLEPLQSANSLEGQIAELAIQLKHFGSEPKVLLGSSWGAILALLFAARFPEQIKKLLLVGSAVFDSQSSRQVKAIRMERLSKSRREEFLKLAENIADLAAKEQNLRLAEMADILLDADAFDPVTRDLEVIETQYALNQKVWGEFVALRDQPGKLAEELAKIQIPTLIIHGDHDPHLLSGIEPFLRSSLRRLQVEWLGRCGHYPWIERQARDQFFEVVIRELGQ